MLAAVLCGGASAVHAAELGMCPDAPAEFASVNDVGPDLALTLGDGRVLRLAGIEPPRATADAPTRPQDVRARVGHLLGDGTVGMAVLGARDRWGRVPAVVFSERGDLAEQVVAAGDVRTWPDRVAHVCREALLRAETGARDTRRGVWGDRDLVVRAATDGAPALPDGMVVVEGVVASVGETTSRLFINLGQRRGGFAISLAKRDIAAMQSEAVTKARTIGARVRVRGLVDIHDGVRIAVSDPDAIEILPAIPGTVSPGSP